jgi:hypothetical protein
MQENDSFLVMEAEKRFLTCSVDREMISSFPVVETGKRFSHCIGGREKIPTL